MRCKNSFYPSFTCHACSTWQMFLFKLNSFFSTFWCNLRTCSAFFMFCKLNLLVFHSWEMHLSWEQKLISKSFANLFVVRTMNIVHVPSVLSFPGCHSSTAHFFVVQSVVIEKLVQIDCTTFSSSTMFSIVCRYDDVHHDPWELNEWTFYIRTFPVVICFHLRTDDLHAGEREKSFHIRFQSWMILISVNENELQHHKTFFPKKFQRKPKNRKPEQKFVIKIGSIYSQTNVFHFISSFHIFLCFIFRSNKNALIA